MPPFKLKTLNSNVLHVSVESIRMYVEYFRTFRFCSTLKYRTFFNLLFASIYDVIYNILKNFFDFESLLKKKFKKVFYKGKFFSNLKILKSLTYWWIRRELDRTFDVLAIHQSVRANSKETFPNHLKNAKKFPKKRRKKKWSRNFWIIKLLYMIQYTTALALRDFGRSTAKCIL